LNWNPSVPRAAATATSLESVVAKIEAHLAALGVALRERDALAIESETLTLQRTLASAFHSLGAAAQQEGGMPLPLRRRLALARGQIAAQRESLRRASAALDRAMDVLLPPDASARPYAADGARARPASTGAIGA
jgi:hypothetical protein